jgi:cell wall-associated NlpC family hydrolase
MGYEMLRRFRNGRKDQGAGTPILMIAMVLALAGAMLLLNRVAQAGDLRTRAQTGADATALGVLAPLREKAVDYALEGFSPAFAGYWTVVDEPEVAADRYAAKNDVKRVDEVALTGALGNTAKVTVHTTDCQLKRKEELTAQEADDLRQGKNLCTDKSGKKGIGRAGNAVAIAKLIMPKCKRVGAEPDENGGPPDLAPALVCGDDNVQAWPDGDREEISKLFKIRLVAVEDTVPYTGMPDGNGVGGGFDFTPTANPPYDPDFGKRVVAWALKWLGLPYSWNGGGPFGPSYGIDQGANTWGFDCSGLTTYALYQASGGTLNVGSYTKTQWNDSRGIKIAAADLKPGDLIFFGDDLHHVAIYMGNNQYVHAPHTGDVVKISTLVMPPGSDYHGAVRFNP